MPESRPTSRWYHITPDRLIVGLLAVEVFLLLSEWFQWFAFNEKKGYTVLIAVEAVCLVVVVMFLWFGVSLLFRWRFQFSLRSLVVLVAAVAVPLGAFGVKLREVDRQRTAVEAIREVGGVVHYDYEVDKERVTVPLAKPPAPAILTKLVGVDSLADVHYVDFSYRQVRDAGLEPLGALTELKLLALSGTQVTDAGVRHLEGLTSLDALNLSATQVTDAGVERLSVLTELKWLQLSNTQVTDAGLEHLSVLTDLESLGLSGTQVTDAGVSHLEGLTRLELLGLDNTQITDTGLENLEGLKEVKLLTLAGTHVTKQGIDELQTALPNCHIDWDGETTNPQDQP